MPPLIKNIFLYFIITSVILSSCTSPNKFNNKEVKHQMLIVDSVLTAGDVLKAFNIVRGLRKQIDNKDPLITTYYTMMVEHYYTKPDSMVIYADSAMAFFSKPERIKMYADEYLKTLLAKGNASFVNKQYNTALDYFYQGKKLVAQGVCDNGILSASIANLYFNQKNYLLAARFWADEVKRQGSCNISLSPQKRFVIKQGALNNCALSYQKAGMDDSAKYYYNLNNKLIQDIEKDSTIAKRYVYAAKVVLYDNLGGLNLKEGKYEVAEKYLLDCININISVIDGVKIPPYIKLAKLYIITGKYEKAKIAFEKSRVLIKKFKNGNILSEVNWNKLYAEYNLKINRPDIAYSYLEKSISLNDSLDNVSANLYRVDVEREMNTLHQQQSIIKLKHQDKLNQIYLLCITIAVVLSIVIIVLIARNLNTSRKNHQDIAEQNQHLQQTLVELEAANKNYIRVMRVMAHDLRNPLSGITGLTSLLLDEDGFDEESKDILQLIESTGLNSIEMINELLKSGLADENETLILQPLDLNALLVDSVKLLQFKANDKAQHLIFFPYNKPVITHGSHEKIWRVFNNLIVNAIKFSHTGGNINIDIAVIDDNKNILVTVTDNGIGIPDKDKDKIFDMFTTAKKAGTGGEEAFGLGLSISKKILEQHGGRLWFTSEPGETVFYVALPYYIA